MKNNTPNTFHELNSARNKKMNELMEEYDRIVYYPALKELQDQCINDHGGHLKSCWHDNGLGSGWWYCNRCSAIHGKEKLR